MIRFPRIRRQERKPHPAEEHALSVFADEKEMQKKVQEIFKIFREGDWGKIQKDKAWKLINERILNSDAEDLRRGIRHAKIMKDPRVVLGQILLYMNVGDEKSAEILKKLIETAPKKDAHKEIGVAMFTHQIVNKVPEVGLRSILERLARWHGYKEEVLEELSKISGNTVWRQEVGAIQETMRRKREGIDELRKKGASNEFAREIQEFVHWQEEEQGKEGVGKEALIWGRRKKRETRWPR